MAEPRERPLNRTAAQVQAILGGASVFRVVATEFREDHDALLKRYPNQRGWRLGEVGDRLRVSEKWRVEFNENSNRYSLRYAADRTTRDCCRVGDALAAVVERAKFFKEADSSAIWQTPWRSPQAMPRWASRLTLEIVSIRVERLHELTEDEALREGIVRRAHNIFHPAIQSSIENPRTRAFACLWDEISGKRYPWESNPWVWRIEFRRLEDARG